MKIEQLYTGCLAEAAYYIESEGEAVVIDPLRESGPYMERAERDGATIKYVLETHFHADFVSGHLDLARKTGATIVYGPTAVPNFEAKVAEDGELLKVGKVIIKVLHTPGHTMESSCFLLIDEHGKDVALFSGDTLFIGDVGRPDLAVKSDLTQEQLAAYLYDSIHTKLMTLPDDVLIYPNHGAGSACGKNMSKETVDTLGNQKKVNYALLAPTKEEFIAQVLDGLTPPPQYFPKNAVMNKMGYESVDDVMARGNEALSVAAFETVVEAANALILDIRKPDTFAAGFIPGSINIGIDGQFASWVGILITDLKQAIVLVGDEGRQEEAVTRLARVGYDNCIGYLQGGFEAWVAAGKEVDTIDSIAPEAFAALLAEAPATPVVDVRRPAEFAGEHVKATDVRNAPLDYLNQYMATIPQEGTAYVHCAGGYRSVVALSILRARGYRNLVNIAGGMGAMRKVENLPLETAVMA